MNKELISNLPINASIGDLQLFDVQIDHRDQVAKALTIFREEVTLPGILVTNGDAFVSMISKTSLYAWMSRPYSQELYSRRPIKFLLDNNACPRPVIFPSYTTIAEAALRSLDRGIEAIYEPIIVRFSDNIYKMLDIHHLLFAQATLHMKYAETLKRANEFKSEILSIAAHDLKNPLNTILGLSAILSEEELPSEEVMNMAGLMRSSSEHMLELITQLLESSVADFGKLELNKSEVDLTALLTGVVNSNKRISEKKKQTIIFENKVGDSCSVQADNSKLREAIDNIVNNAVKYSRCEGTIHVALYDSEGSISIAVKDEGPGFTPEDKQKVFGKFQRLSAKPTGGETSTGLGLYIVKQIIELHNGNIAIESEHGIGSTFIIDFPKN